MKGWIPGAKVIGMLLALMLVLILVAGCGDTSVNTTVSSGTPDTGQTSSTAPGSSGGTETSGAGGATKTLKIGIVAWMGYSGGLNLDKTIKASVDAVNEAGGLAVGSDRYSIEIVSYDTQNVQATEIAAVNRLVYEDEVSIILTEGDYAASWLSVTEGKKILVLASSPAAYLSDPKYQYVFTPSFFSTSPAVVVGWFTKNYPNVKTVVGTTDESEKGHMVAALTNMYFTAYGLQKQDVFYPPDATDISSVGTKIVQIGPDAMFDAGASAIGYKAAVQAGYKGQLFTIITRTTADLKTYLSDSDLEGLVGGAFPTEFEPAATERATQFISDYTAVYGKWDNPDIQGAVQFACLAAAVKQAGSLDPDKLAAAIGGGMEFDTPLGLAKMITKAGAGNDRTTDAICTTYIKRLEAGQPKLVATIGLDEAMAYYNVVFGNASQPGTTEAPPAAGTEIGWDKAKGLTAWDQEVTVAGPVDSTVTPSATEALILLGGGMGQGFILFVPDSSKLPVGFLDSLKGKIIAATGKLAKFSFTGEASINITDPSQIVIK